MNKEPINYNNPLGISKREWTKVLGANLALLLTVYVVALICTLCGSDFFMLRFYSEDLQRIETTLRNWNCFAVLQIAFKTLEATVIATYASNRKPRWWMPVGMFAVFVSLNLIFANTLGYYPSAVSFVVEVLLILLVVVFYEHKGWKPFLKAFARLAIGLAVSFALNELIGLFRTYYFGFWRTDYTASVAFAMNVEYMIALVLSLLFLSLLTNWESKGGNEQWSTNLGASGSSPTSTKQSPKPAPKTKRNSELPPKLRKRIRLLKAKYFAVQTIALLVVSALPIVSGKGVEYALAFASFSLTRLCLGFNRSLHFKSELTCVSVGALCFWGISFLAPSVEASLIFSMVYGCALAIGFRLYWELHDLILYKRAAKLDRYAMFYAVFKGDVSERHVRGVMVSKGYGKQDVLIVTLYMQREKVEAIAIDLDYSKRVIETRLTELASEMYLSR